MTQLDSGRLCAFVDDVHRYLVSRDEEDHDYQMLARLAKLTEEVGELSEQLLGKLGQQRAAKEHISDDALGAEVADVMICAILIAKTADIDRVASLHAKIDKIRARLDL